MSFSKAKDAFKDAQRYMNAKQEPVLWDMNLGLLRLADAIEDELRAIRSQIDDLRRRGSR